MDVFEPHDEAERVKAWIRSYGGAVVGGVVLGLVALGAFNYWKHYQQHRAERASVAFERMLGEFDKKQLKTARADADTLMTRYAGTPYAGKAALLVARMDDEAGDATGARKALRFAMEHASEAITRQVARLRLARATLDGGDAKGALALLDTKDKDGFASDYDEVRGDALVKLGQPAQARAAYESALKALAPNSPYARVLRLKIDNLASE